MKYQKDKIIILFQTSGLDFEKKQSLSGDIMSFARISIIYIHGGNTNFLFILQR